jgi:RimJ/RimL family protein N-acetyltransferase
MIDIPFTTERLVVRRFAKEDLAFFLRFMLDPESTKYLAFDEAQKTQKGAKAQFDQVVSAYDKDDAVHSYAIAEKHTNLYLGSCGFAHYDREIVECYFCVNAEHRGRGIATEAVRALTSRLAATYEVRAYCHPDNRAAHTVLKTCGFRPAGLSTHKNFGFDGVLFTYPREGRRDEQR